ncbi:thiopurine S-methyltransferase [Aureococcus anophagefferens]|nr:thiopurine S-methyltransferase [Aureococcus anophagefferens]
MASLAAAQDSSDSDDEAHFWPFAEAFEDDTQTYPYGTLSAVASHVTTPRETALAAARLGDVARDDVFVDLGCGVGAVTNLVHATVGCACLGIDCCEAEVAAARRAAAPPVDGHAATYVTCDLFDMPRHVAGVEAARLVVYMHLIPKLVCRSEVRDLLEPYVRAGARVITSKYHPDYWRAARTDGTLDLRRYDAASLSAADDARWRRLGKWRGFYNSARAHLPPGAAPATRPWSGGAAELARYLEAAPRARALDVGCGTGENLAARARFDEALGVGVVQGAAGANRGTWRTRARSSATSSRRAPRRSSAPSTSSSTPRPGTASAASTKRRAFSRSCGPRGGSWSSAATRTSPTSAGPCAWRGPTSSAPSTARGSCWALSFRFGAAACAAGRRPPLGWRALWRRPAS